MRINRFVVFIVAVGLLSSCVSNKKFLLMQKDDVNKKNLPNDTIVRAYQRIEFNYKIQPQDNLSIRFESLTQEEFDFLNRGQMQSTNINLAQGGGVLTGDLVDMNGDVPFPFIGKVHIAGLTIYEAQDKLQAISSQYLDSPKVKVRLINFRFTMLGEVNMEGTHTLYNNRVNFLEAIGLAGGMSDLADKEHVKLLRQVGEKTEVVYLNMRSEDFMASPYYFVHQNDILIVPALRQRPYRKYFGQNLALVVSSLSLLLVTIDILQH